MASSAMYLDAAACVQQQRTPFFDEVRACIPICIGPGYDGDTGEME